MYKLKVNAPVDLTVEEISDYVRSGMDEYDEKRFVTSHDSMENRDISRREIDRKIVEDVFCEDD